MAKLSDRQRKQIIAEYVSGDGIISQRELAKKYGVCLTTISKILGNGKVVQKCINKKEENTQTMLAFMDSKREIAQDLIAEILTTSKEQIKEAPLREKMGALKILSETFTRSSEGRAESKSALDRLCESLDKVIKDG